MEVISEEFHRQRALGAPGSRRTGSAGRGLTRASGTFLQAQIPQVPGSGAPQSPCWGSQCAQLALFELHVTRRVVLANPNTQPRGAGGQICSFARFHGVRYPSPTAAPATTATTAECAPPASPSTEWGEMYDSL